MHLKVSKVRVQQVLCLLQIQCEHDGTVGYVRFEPYIGLNSTLLQTGFCKWNAALGYLKFVSLVVCFFFCFFFKFRLFIQNFRFSFIVSSFYIQLQFNVSNITFHNIISVIIMLSMINECIMCIIIQSVYMHFLMGIDIKLFRKLIS